MTTTRKRSTPVTSPKSPLHVAYKKVIEVTGRRPDFCDTHEGGRMMTYYTYGPSSSSAMRDKAEGLGWKTINRQFQSTCGFAVFIDAAGDIVMASKLEKVDAQQFALAMGMLVEKPDTIKVTYIETGHVSRTTTFWTDGYEYARVIMFYDDDTGDGAKFFAHEDAVPV